MNLIDDANAFAATDAAYQPLKDKVAADQDNVDRTQATINDEIAANAAYAAAHKAVTDYLAQFPPGSDTFGFDPSIFSALSATLAAAAPANVSPAKLAADQNTLANVTAQLASHQGDAAPALAADQAAWQKLQSDVNDSQPK